MAYGCRQRLEVVEGNGGVRIPAKWRGSTNVSDFGRMFHVKHV